VLHDTPENIMQRIIYTDANDNIIENPPNADYKSDLRDIKYFINRYKTAFSKIENHYFINAKNARETASYIVTRYSLYVKMMSND
jgi:hypothetical protein